MKSTSSEVMLTAYALGELGPGDRQAVESALAEDPQDRQYVEHVQAIAVLLADELAREESPGLEAIHYAAIEMMLRQPAPAVIPNRRAIIRARIGLALSLAASIVIVCGAIFALSSALFHTLEMARAPRRAGPSSNPVIPQSRASDRTSDTDAGGAAPGTGDFVPVAERPISSFPIAVDAASYQSLRRALSEGMLPAPRSIRIAQLVNAFAYDDPPPIGAAAFGARIEIGPCPWENSHQLARIGIKARAGTGIVARDVKTEVTFNSDAAASYRLIGYDDRSDAAASDPSVEGGHAVTALYEVVPNAPAAAPELLTVRMRYVDAAAKQTPQVMEFKGKPSPREAMSPDFSFSAAVAEFGMLLKQPVMRTQAGFDSVLHLAAAGLGADPDDQRRQFINLVREAQHVDAQRH